MIYNNSSGLPKQKTTDGMCILTTKTCISFLNDCSVIVNFCKHQVPVQRWRSSTRDWCPSLQYSQSTNSYSRMPVTWIPEYQYVYHQVQRWSKELENEFWRPIDLGGIWNFITFITRKRFSSILYVSHTDWHHGPVVQSCLTAVFVLTARVSIL